MRLVRRHLFIWTALLLGALPTAALADTLNPIGSNAWDFYVYGSGSAIAQILTALKLVLAPSNGGGGFRTLLLAVAMLGFLALAIRAGFDPAKNFLKMFGFILLIGAVMYGTEEANVNVTVVDQLTGYSTTVPGVPAIVGLPASLVSEVGYWLTQKIEQDFSTPSALQITGSGQFDMFGKVLSDMNKTIITDPDLKASLSAYVNDCVVPEMALGNVSASALIRSTNLITTLQGAASKAMLTRYFPMSADNAAGAPETGGCLAAQTDAITSGGAQGSGTTGELMTCADAYACFTSDLNFYAQNLLTANASQWQNSGIEAPFATAMQDALAEASSPGSAATPGGGGSPEDAILQAAMVNSMSGAFRAAAARTGNNSMMLATSIAQADQSQVTSWYTAAQIFQNLMGYVYIVLQAFILGIVPIVVVALMIPGIGVKIFTNYLEVLVWLTLWSPIMAVLNFIVTVLGGSTVGSVAVLGDSIQSHATISQYTNYVVIAAQFLGTMIPLLTWGLVKGSLAFTEFISHGIGSSFASQAGAQAATGNISMGNDSMNNVGMDKYNTSMAATVGADQVSSIYGGGAVDSFDKQGGSHSAAYGVQQTKSVREDSSVSFKTATGTVRTSSIGAARQFVSQNQQAINSLKQTQTQLQSQASNLHKMAANEIAQTGHMTKTTSDALTANTAAQRDATQIAAKLSAGAGWKAETGAKDFVPIVGGSVNTRGGLDVADDHQQSTTIGLESKQAYDKAIAADKSYLKNDSVSDDGTTGISSATSAADSKTLADNSSATTSLTNNMATAENYLNSWERSYTASTTTTVTSGAMDNGSAGGGGLRTSVGGQLGQGQADTGGAASLGGQNAAAASRVNSELNAGRAAYDSAHAKLAGRATGTVAGVPNAVVAAQSNVPKPPSSDSSVRVAAAKRASNWSIVPLKGGATRLLHDVEHGRR